MPESLPKQYDPRSAQARLLAFWESRGYNHSRPDPNREPFCIVIPPPNVTGALHLGHALNNTLQDVLIRWKRMQGYNALYLPGTDHAGIATQAVVERRILEEEGKTRHDLGREELVKRIWQWKDEYEARILRQLRELGCSCDWERTRFTLDPVCTRAVRHTFFRMFKDGLIYRGRRLVNWDTELQTPVADDETYTEEVQGGFWTFKYPVKGSDEFIRFSTTRPETMLGDTAVAVHPDDPRYKHLIGKTVIVPLVDREIPIIADRILADPELGTGAVKVTPAHDPNDYECGLRHKLPMINILNPDGTINENGGRFAGLDRYVAREKVIEAMAELGLYEGREDRIIPLKFSDRSKTPIEPYLSDQWFVYMGDHDDKPGLAQTAMDAVQSGEVRIFPARYAKTYLDWLSEKRDWCISRQLWWGHRIPVWKKSIAQELRKEDIPPRPRKPVDRNTERDPRHVFLKRKFQEATGLDLSPYTQVIAEAYRYNKEEKQIEAFIFVDYGQETIEKYLESCDFTQDPDVLDTWFSSALWPHATLGWPEQTPDLAYYYPTSVLVTSRDIITLWVARMVLTGIYNTGKIPFYHVYIHTKILDGFGQTMSKSKGNGIDPLDIIEVYGTDALRYGIVRIATESQDVRMPVYNICPHCSEQVPVKLEHMYMKTRKVQCPKCKKPFRPGGPWPSEDPELPTAKQASEQFLEGRNFANKIWNAARFLLMNLDDYTPQAIVPEKLPIEDRWILSRLAYYAGAITDRLGAYHFAEVGEALYRFTWSEFCDWYIEMAKGRLRDEDSRPLVQRMLVAVLDHILRLAHPIMPFVTEAIWQALNEKAFERGIPSPQPAEESVMIAAWPEVPDAWRDEAIEQRIERMQELVRNVREIRSRYGVPPKADVDVHVRAAAELADDFRNLLPFIRSLAGVRNLEAGPEVDKPRHSAGYVARDFELYVPLEGLIDVEKEAARLEKQLEQLRKRYEGAVRKLNNEGFTANAPAEVVEQQRRLAADLTGQIENLERNLAELRS